MNFLFWSRRLRKSDMRFSTVRISVPTAPIYSTAPMVVAVSQIRKTKNEHTRKFRNHQNRNPDHGLDHQDPLRFVKTRKI